MLTLISSWAWRNFTFIKGNELQCCDTEQLPNSSSFTFIGYGDSQSRWLDHVGVTAEDSRTSPDFKMLHDLITCDHVPLPFKLWVTGSQLHNIVNHSVKTDIHVNYKVGKKSKYEYIRIARYVRNLENCHEFPFQGRIKVGWRDPKTFITYLS